MLLSDTERPTRPERPAAPPGARSKSSLIPVIMVLVPLGVVLTGVVALAGQAGLMMIGVATLIPAFMFLHYLLWGRWLMKSLKQHPPESDDDA